MVIEIGEKAPNFELVDTELKFRTLDEFKGKKVVISFFVAASSPVCEVELCTFRDKWNEISELGAQVIAISNDGPFANKAFAEKNNYNFPYVQDPRSQLASEFGATKTPHIYLFDNNDVLVYRGAIDDNARDARTVEEPFLANAIDQLLSGRSIEKPTSKAIGCSIKFP